MKKSMLSTKQSYLVCAIGVVALFGILMGVCESGMASTYIKGIMMTCCIAIIMTTSLNLTIVSSDVENGVLAIKGAIPGPKGSIVLVRSAVKGA